jgi:hypothetical protein
MRRVPCLDRGIRSEVHFGVWAVRLYRRLLPQDLLTRNRLIELPNDLTRRNDPPLRTHSERGHLTYCLSVDKIRMFAGCCTYANMVDRDTGSTSSTNHWASPAKVRSIPTT